MLTPPLLLFTVVLLFIPMPIPILLLTLMLTLGPDILTFMFDLGAFMLEFTCMFIPTPVFICTFMFECIGCTFEFMLMFMFPEGGGTFMDTFMLGGGGAFTFICTFMPPMEMPTEPKETVKTFMGMMVGAQFGGALK